MFDTSYREYKPKKLPSYWDLVDIELLVYCTGIFTLGQVFFITSLVPILLESGYKVTSFGLIMINGFTVAFLIWPFIVAYEEYKALYERSLNL